MIILFDLVAETLSLNDLSVIFAYDILLWYMNKSKEAQIIYQNYAHIILFLLHVLAFLESHHQAIQKICKERQFKYTHWNDSHSDSWDFNFTEIAFILYAETR